MIIISSLLPRYDTAPMVWQGWCSNSDGMSACNIIMNFIHLRHIGYEFLSGKAINYQLRLDDELLLWNE